MKLSLTLSNSRLCLYILYEPLNKLFHLGLLIWVQIKQKRLLSLDRRFTCSACNNGHPFLQILNPNWDGQTLHSMSWCFNPRPMSSLNHVFNYTRSLSLYRHWYVVGVNLDFRLGQHHLQIPILMIQQSLKYFSLIPSLSWTIKFRCGLHFHLIASSYSGICGNYRLVEVLCFILSGIIALFWR